MKFRKFMAYKAVTLCFIAIFIVMFCAFLGIIDIGAKLILIVAVTSIALTAAWLISEYIKLKNRIVKLNKLNGQLEQKYLIGEVLPPPKNEIEEAYFNIMKQISRSAISAAEDAINEKEYYKSYVESWIHEIKTPLTAAELILANGGDVKKLKRELKRADNLTETILYYARLKSIEKDTLITKFNVIDAVNDAVLSQKELILAANVKISVSGGFTVNSDMKQLVFILKQLIVNCARYCSGGKVEITADSGVISVTDNGIGIPTHEIMRVTERGFTATNARKTSSGGTGMGLYIVSELCKNLGIELSVKSKLGENTTVTLKYPFLTKE